MVRLDLAEAVLPYAQFLIVTHEFLRVFLFLATLKYRSLAKLEIYFECVLPFLEALTVVWVPLDRSSVLHMMMMTITFWLGYFSFWPGLIAIEIAVIPLYVNRYVFFGEDGYMLTVTCLFWMFNLFVAAVFVHLIVSKVGMIFVDADVLREGNEMLLDSIE